MITKWKTILTNWINCNLNEPNTGVQTVNQDSLLRIVSHLHSNCLDESKSSILEAQTLEEFLIEKYPDFQFENGTVEATSDEELYTVASLLLFFVCVSSKDADLKNAMCSKLSPGDQEIILMFSKSLLECPAVTFNDVQAAILEACGDDVGGSEIRGTVAETPPALRSLHCDVRRLHAALDAERFDRNYLQEELARTQHRLDILAKEKEEQKQTILALKAKVSECCGQEVDDRIEGSNGDAASSELRRQMSELEQRLADTMAKLDDLAYERDAYKAKAEELKRERDKCFEFGQRESSHAVELLSQLEEERRAVASLEDLVAELRQHHRRNGLDGSLLECDDIDASSLSLHHNMSVSNEACANVVELQLGEERARVAELRKLMQDLQDQLTQLNQRAEEEKLSLQKIISDKDEDILNLKHRINEGIEETNHVKAHLSNEITKLNNDVNELEQKIRTNNEHYSRIIEGKMREVQTLQEEKLSLLQSLTDETTKLDNVIKQQDNTIHSLKSELHAERNSKQKLKEDYEAQVMTLKEKVLNRNNELVELQNNASKNSETIEALHFEVRKEKENERLAKAELENQTTLFNARLTQGEASYNLKLKEVQELQVQLEQKGDIIKELEGINIEIQQELTTLKDTEAKLTEVIQSQNSTIDAYEADIVTLQEQERALTQRVNESEATIAELSKTIQARDVTMKCYERDIDNYKEAEQVLTLKINENLAVIAEITREIESRESTIISFDKNVKTLNNALREQEQNLSDKIIEKEAAVAELSQQIQARENTIKSQEKDIETLNRNLKEQEQVLSNKIYEKEAVIVGLTQEIKEHVVTMESYRMDIEALNETLKDREQVLSDNIHENEATINEFKQEILERDNISKTHEEDIKTLKEQVRVLCNEINEKQAVIAELSEELQARDATIKSYEKDIDALNDTLKEQKQALCHETYEKETVIADMAVTIQARDNTIKSYEKDIEHLNFTLSEQKDTLTSQINEKEADINQLQVQLTREIKSYERDIDKLHKNLKEREEALTHNINEKEATIGLLQMQLQSEIKFRNRHQLEMEELQKARDSLVSEVEKLSEEFGKLNQETQQKNKMIEAMDLYLQEEKKTRSTLTQDCEELNDVVKNLRAQFANDCLEKDKIIDSVKNKLTGELTEKKELIAQADSLKNELDVITNEVAALRESNSKLSHEVTEKESVIQKLEQDMSELTIKYKSLSSDFDSETSKLMTRLNETERILKELRSKSNKIIESQSLQVQTLQMEIGNLQQLRDVDRQVNDVIQLEKETLLSKMGEQNTYQLRLEEEYMNQCKVIDEITSKLSQELVYEKTSVGALEEQLKDYNEDIASLKKQLAEKTDTSDKLVAQKVAEIEKLTEEIAELSSRNEILGEKFNKEMQSKSVTVEALQKEIEKLLYTIEEDNSIHEVMLIEKDRAIEYLEQNLKDTKVQLTTIQTDFEERTLVWEKIKLELKERLRDKDNQIVEMCNQLSEAKACIAKVTNDFKQEKDELNSQIAALQIAKEELETKFRTETQSLQDAVMIETDNVNEIIHQKEVLQDQLAEEKGMVESLQSEKNVLCQLLEEKKGYIDLLERNKQDLEVTSNAVNQYLTAEKKAKEELSEKLSSEIAEKRILIEEKEILTQQLVDEKSSIDILQNEKSMLRIENDTLINDKDDLQDQINNLRKKYHESELEKEVLLKESDYLMKQITDEKLAKEKFEKSKNSLVSLNQTLIKKVADETAINSILVQEKELLMAEKESLVMNLSEEKAAKDMVENEKEIQDAKLNELKQRQADVLNSNLEEIKKASEELKALKNDLNEKCDLTERLTKTLNSGLGKLLKSLQNEDIQNELLKKLIAVDNVAEIPLNQQCDLLINIADALSTELALRRNLEKALEHENSAMSDLREMLKQKEMELHELQTECKNLEQSFSDLKSESTMQRETLTSNLKDKSVLIQSLERENKSLNTEINDVKLQLELKVHSLKEKLADTELVTDKLKRMYESQIENLNLMADKLTHYLKDKTVELDSARRETEKLQRVIDEDNKVINALEESAKSRKQNEEKLITDFESERAILKNMVTVTESVMEDQKATFEKLLAENSKIIDNLEKQNESLNKQVEAEKQNAAVLLKEKDSAFETLFNELTEVRARKECFQKEVETLRNEVVVNMTSIEAIEEQKKGLADTLDKKGKELANMNEKLKDLFTEKEELRKALQAKEIEYTNELQNKEIGLTKKIKEKDDKIQDFEKLLEQKELKLQEFNEKTTEIENKMKIYREEIDLLTNVKNNLETEKTQWQQKFEQFKAESEISDEKGIEEIQKLREENLELVKIVGENKSVIANLDQLINHELEQNQQLREQTAHEKLSLTNKCSILEQYQEKAEKEIEERRKEVSTMNAEIKTLKAIVESANVKDKSVRDSVLDTVTKDLAQEQILRAKSEKELEMKSAELEVKSAELIRAKDEVLKLKSEREGLLALRKANEELFKSVSQRDTLLTATKEMSAPAMKVTKQHGDSHKVPTPPNDTTHTSLEITKTIVDLETIIHDKNRTITALQSDLTYLRTQIEDYETKMEHLTNELDISKETSTQLASQLKKVVNQKNEEIADLKKQVSKMSVTENRATQIIKVSAKYQAIILKRIAEIKSNTVLKELTNFGNAANVDNELRRSIAGSVTMEDLENFLETTDRHLRRCSEKQIALQKERDRLAEVNKINESEIINMKKFLTEMSVGFKTFVSVKEIYAQRLSRIVSLQRTVRREILNLDGQITDAAMCHLERGYTAVIQDLAECAMNLERWVERSISRTISSDKIKQAFASELDRASMACGSYQNTGLEVQLDELETSFQKLLEEVLRAQRGEGAKNIQAVTVMEVRAEYEDKLNRMKSKMKQLYQEQIAIFRDKQKEEVAVLERELQKARDKMADSSRAYEAHIRSLTAELWSVGEKFLMKKDEAEWLRRNRSGSLQSLQNMHSSGMVAHDESLRASDVASLRSLPVRPKKTTKGGRGLHMSDEEGEVFDNQCLRELTATPRPSPPPAPGARLSELRWRNSLCPPHLKSSYPAETQFAAVQEDEIKCVGKQQRKEVGITAYKKPGPPTPSKQAGRLSATDCELRESLRPEPEPPRKTSTPSRLRALFRSSRTDNTDGTPRSRRLSIFRSKK